MLIRGRNTKIIATLGPASSTLESIEALFLAGADVFRLNFSHGDHAGHLNNIEIIHTLEEKHGRPIGILADLQGPKIRIGTFEGGPVTLDKGQNFDLHLDPIPGDNTRVHLPHPEIFHVATVGMDLLLDDGKIRLKVRSVSSTVLSCTVTIPGVLSNKKGVNVPGAHLPIPAMTEKDERDLAFILAQDIPWIALSFVQTRDDIDHAKSIINGKAKIVAKLEKPQAIKHLSAIVDASDAIMIARGDLGVEVPPEEVPSIQKRIIRACRATGKPVIVATQMMESMIASPTPTRAETSDIANAIYDHVDCVMLSAESASGAYPRESVAMMHRILHHTEKDIVSDYHVIKHSAHTTLSDAITAAAREITQHLNVKAIVTLTASGATTYAAAKERPYAPIVALTQNKRTARELCLCWGAYSIVVDIDKSVSIDILAVNLLKENKFAHAGDKIIITSGIPFQKESTNVLKIVEIA
ncbi:MAG: pyruvate kinase [Alphaproteobacteria bacterium]|nr:pyruvate kinase [Alphaproteobacteria bacterium]